MPDQSLGPRRMTPLLNVEDVVLSIAFYQTVAGFEVTKSWEVEGVPQWAELHAGEVSLMLNHPDGADSAHRRARPSYGEVVFYFVVEDVEALHRDLTARGYAPGPVERQFYGMEDFVLRDPDGYELAFGAPVAQD